MSIRYWIATIAFGLIFSTFSVVLAEDYFGPALESEPLSDVRENPGVSARETHRNNEDQPAFDPTAALKGIESPIRALETKEDEAERQRQDSRNVHDLNAQEDMAFAKLMFWATFVTVWPLPPLSSRL